MGSGVIQIRDEASVGLVRMRVRELGTEISMDTEGIELFAAAASELGFNQLNHARFGEVGVRVIHRGDPVGLELHAMDRGPGIADPPAALAGRLVGKGLGAGLAAVRRAVHEIDTDIRHCEGSTVVIRRFVHGESAPPRHPEFAIEGRPYPGEAVSGDDAVFIRNQRGFLVAVADGLGHGPAARAASQRAMEVVLDLATHPLLRIVSSVDSALRSTRGAALTVARYDVPTEQLRLCGVGNIDTRIIHVDHDEFHHTPRSGTLGVRQGTGSPTVRTVELGVGSMLCICTDGIRRRDRMNRTPGLEFHSAAWTAHHLLTEHARATDDALVLAVR